MSKERPRIVAIGECMVEFREVEPGVFRLGFGGDTLNTAVYLARLGMPVDYATALGDDARSAEMMAAWAEEGVGVDTVLRVPGANPGLYVIEVDERGERRFSYWRDCAPARRLFALPDTERLEARLLSYDIIYLSGISLSLYGERGRERLFATLEKARERGARISFDTNYRPRGWPVMAEAREAFDRALALSDIVFASVEDLEALYGMGFGDHLARLARSAERVVKHDDLTVRIERAGEEPVVVAGERAPRVVDTTAAGDSFAAGFLAARLRGASPAEAAQAAHRLAREVVAHPGALIPREAMRNVAA